MAKIPYNSLPIIPYIMAEKVANDPYIAIEFSNVIRSAIEVKRIESLRQKLTTEQIKEFCEWVDNRCRYCYENNIEWFMKLVRSKTNRGRDQLYVWFSHWLSAYLTNPEIVNRE